ncbi:uncharacterized protein LOC132700652 isoform X2 [Cylas formicarius]|uniref:uncharacterized protein LOC132700652 isoform X2 n=1 Tax=Cylas formicarius TaxID=197179 RepID=UPI0029589346|nr:uncharacterized protein LOC132700652 isoform X2 [Cylas formicarius]
MTGPILGYKLLVLAAVFQQVKTEEPSNVTLSFDGASRMKRNTPRRGRHEHHHLEGRFVLHGMHPPYMHDSPFMFPPGRHLSPRDNQKLLHHEYQQYEMAKKDQAVDCCPSVLEMVEPEGGKNDQDIYVELYKSENYRQRFYELSCHKDVLNKPCRFMEKKLHEHSRCIQMHSYTYALVKDTPDHRNKNLPTFPGQGAGNNTYTLDYISVRSGCSCVVMPNQPKKKRNRLKHKRKHETAAHDER